MVIVPALIWLVACSTASLLHANSDFIFMEVKVLDPEGKPMAEVPVDIRIDGAEFPMPTDENGLISFNVPATGTRMRLKVNQPGFVSQAAHWLQGDKVPEAFTIRMEKGSTIGGIIQDEQGEPIEGVQIEAHTRSESLMLGGGRVEPTLSGVIATTDSEGRWKFDSAPSKRIEILTDFQHPDFVYENVFGYRAGNWEELHSLKHIVVLQRGVPLRGQVLDPDGVPAAGAKVTLSKGRYYSDQIETTTDADGNYRLQNVKPSGLDITVLSSDWAPETKRIVASLKMEPVDFALKNGEVVTFRITDPDGQPIEGVQVTPDEWRGLEILPRSPTKTNKEGIWEWTLAPADKINYRLYKEGHMSTGITDVVPRDEPYEVTMPPELVFVGTVTDAKTGKLLDNFQVVEGIYWRESDKDVVWQEHRKEPGKAGKYRVAYNSGYAGFKIKVEAEGYHPQASRLVAVDEGEVTIHFALEPGAGPTGVIKLADGSPAIGAEVLMADDSQSRITIHNGEYQRQTRTIMTETDATGKFSLPIPQGPYSLVCLHEGGWASLLEQPPKKTDHQLVLEPWASVEGNILEGKKSVAGGTASLWYPDLEKQMRSSLVQWTYRALTDGQGNFSMPRVRSGEATIQRNVRFSTTAGRGLGSYSTQFRPCKLLPNETTTVQLGGTGREVVGKLLPPENYDSSISWDLSRVTLTYRTERGKSGAQTADTLSDEEQLAEAEKLKYQRYTTQANSDGTFKIPDVLPGKYTMNVTVYQLMGENYNWEPLAQAKQVITVDEGEESQPVEVGEHAVKLVQSANPPQPTN